MPSEAIQTMGGFARDGAVASSGLDQTGSSGNISTGEVGVAGLPHAAVTFAICAQLLPFLRRSKKKTSV